MNLTYCCHFDHKELTRMKQWGEYHNIVSIWFRMGYINIIKVWSSVSNTNSSWITLHRKTCFSSFKWIGMVHTSSQRLILRSKVSPRIRSHIPEDLNKGRNEQRMSSKQNKRKKKSLIQQSLFHLFQCIKYGLNICWEGNLQAIK